MNTEPNVSHTPGPWHLGGNGFIVYAQNGYAICDVKTFHGRSNDDKANATLIAVAPELLKACKQALYALKGREHDGFLRDVIAKAEGV